MWHRWYVWIWEGKSNSKIIEDALTLEDKLRVYIDKNELANLEQDGVGNRKIWNGITQDCDTWDMIGSQEEE